MEQKVDAQVDKDRSVRSDPVLDQSPFVDGHVLGVSAPGKVGEKRHDLSVSGQLSCVELPGERRETHGRDEPGDDQRVDESVGLQELGQPLAAPHPQDVPPVGVDKDLGAHAAKDSDHGVDQEFPGVVGVFASEAGPEERRDRVLLAEPDGKQSGKRKYQTLGKDTIH